jgi:hypothetical protein
LQVSSPPATRDLVPITYRRTLLSPLLHATIYICLRNLLIVLVKIANKMGLQKILMECSLYVPMYVCMYVCMNECAYIFMHVCAWLYSQVPKYINKNYYFSHGCYSAKSPSTTSMVILQNNIPMRRNSFY